MKKRTTLFFSILAISNSHAQGFFERLSNSLKPAPQFAGIKLDTSIQDAKKLGFTCTDGSDTIKGKLINYSYCEDVKYTGELFGLTFKKRIILFANNNLASVKVIKRDAEINESTFFSVSQKLDSALKRIQINKKRKDDGVIWDLGSGYILTAAPPTRIYNSFPDMSKYSLSFGMVAFSPLGRELID